MREDLDLHRITDDRARALVQQLCNLREAVRADLRAAQAAIQRLRHESNRLKGEQGQPRITPNTPHPPPQDHASEPERRTPKTWSKGRKTDRIPMDRAQMVQVDPAHLPSDAVCKGDEAVVGPDVIVRTDTLRFQTETCDAPSPQQTSLASLPEGSRGPFGPGLKRLARVCDAGAQMREPKVADGQVSNLRINDHALFHAEKAALSHAGLASSPWPQLEDTGTRVNGQHGSGHIVCHPRSTAYGSTAAKDRLTIIDVLRNHRPRRVLVKNEAGRPLEACGSVGGPAPAVGAAALWGAHGCSDDAGAAGDAPARLGAPATDVDPGRDGRGSLSPRAGVSGGPPVGV